MLVLALVLQLAIQANNQAETYRMQGQYKEAEASFKKAAGLLRNEPESGKELVVVLNNTGALYRDMELYMRAGAIYEESLALAKKTFAPNDVVFGNIYTGLAAASSARGEMKEARKYLEEALRIFEKAPGTERQDVAETLNNLGAVQLKMKDYAKAEQTLLKALKADAENGTVLNNLGSVYLGQKKTVEAEKMFRRALNIYNDGFQVNRRRTADALLNLASVLLEEKRPAEAEPLLKEAVEIRDSVRRTIDAEDALTYEQYAAALRMNGNDSEADAAAERAKRMRMELRYTLRPQEIG